MKENNTEPDLLEGEDEPERKRVNSNNEPIAFEDTADKDDAELAERQDSFDAGVNEWKGRGLLPYSSSRDALFSRLRNLMGAPDIREAVMEPSLFVADAHLILFLCSHDELYLVRHMSKPDDLLVAVMSWADENVKAEDTNEAVTLALTIFLSKTINTAENAPDGSDSDSSELGN